MDVHGKFLVGVQLAALGSIHNLGNTQAAGDIQRQLAVVAQVQAANGKVFVPAKVDAAGGSAGGVVGFRTQIGVQSLGQTAALGTGLDVVVAVGIMVDGRVFLHIRGKSNIDSYCAFVCFGRGRIACKGGGILWNLIEIQLVIIVLPILEILDTGRAFFVRVQGRVLGMVVVAVRGGGHKAGGRIADGPALGAVGFAGVGVGVEIRRAGHVLLGHVGRKAVSQGSGIVCHRAGKHIAHIRFQLY